MSYGVGHRHGLNLALLWLWCRPAAAFLIRPIARELPYATGAALKKMKKFKKKILKDKILFQNLSLLFTLIPP